MEGKRLTRKSTLKNQTRRKSTSYVGHISNYQSPESIVKILLDKIINLSIRQSLINKINNQIHSYCFEYMQNQIEPILEINYINYMKTNYNEDIYFWKNPKPVEGKWMEIAEPDIGEYDRFEGAFARIKEVSPKTKKPTISRIKEGFENEINSVDINEGKTLEEIEKEKNNKNKRVQVRKKLSNFENNENKTNTMNNINNNINTNIKEEEKSTNKQDKMPKINKINKKMIMFNFPTADIPDIDREFKHEEYDPPDVNKLRKEVEEEIKKREKEKKIRIDAAKIIKKKEDNEKINKKVKLLDSNKYTFDPEGKIISFKHYRIDNLTRDFAFIKNGIKEMDIKAANKKKKGAVIISEKNENDESEKINEEVIKNPMMEEEERKEKSQAEKTNEKKEKIIPSGSNFQIILPNIGVVIKENQNIKEGGREFNKFFNKYSINDYDKILKEYVPLQNKSKIRNKMELLGINTTNNIKTKTSESADSTKINNSQNNLNNVNKTFNYNYETINSNNNPLLTTNDLQINNSIDNNMLMTIDNTSPYLKTSIGNSFNKRQNNYNPLLTSFMNYSQGKKGYSLSNSIQMKPGLGSLKIEIDNMQELKNEKTYYGPVNIKQKNIFRKDLTRNYKIGLIKSPGNYFFSSFNKNILTDENWGNEIGGKGKNKNSNTIFARHHTKQQALRELGNTIFSGLKIKLPRDRKVELNK